MVIDFKFDTQRISDIHPYIVVANLFFTYRARVGRNDGKQRLLHQGIAEWNSLDKRDMRSL